MLKMAGHFRVPLTLILPLDIDASTNTVKRVLLGYKKRGFGQGKWNGFGGKLEAGETVAQAALRELQEESGLTGTLEDLTYRGYNDFEFEGERKVLQVFVYEIATSACTGTPTESDEMRPQWFDVADLPFGSMWVDDAIWLPLLLAHRTNAAGQQRTFVGEYVFRGHETILAKSVRLLEATEDGGKEAKAALERVAAGPAVNDSWVVPSKSLGYVSPSSS